MNGHAARTRRGAFTLVEMMVVVAIIALLLAALLPAFSAVKTQAKYAQANAQFKALDTGINAFRAEAALGGALPPSAGDDNDPPTERWTIADPQGDDANTRVRIAGAHLLVQAMIGADGLGTPGFRDINRDPKGLWSDDTYNGGGDCKQGGLYCVDTNGKEKFSRYGGAGYVDEKMKENARTLQELADKGSILTNLEAISPRIAIGQRVFTDPWDHPILYYRANPTSLRMTGASGQPGIYWQEDNAIITGSEGGILGGVPGLDFGASGDEHGETSWIHGARSPDPSVAQNANWIDTFRADTQYDHSFAKFILDGSVKARPTPVQKDTYLLVSAGPDAIYGTDDDVLNWTRKTD